MKKTTTLTVLHLIFVGLLPAASLRAAPPLIELSPETFDFGWAPDNAILSCEFNVKNMVGETVALTAVQPSCGCTATDFTPNGLATAEQKKINITFNTRGYSGIKFNKSIQVKAGTPEEDYAVHLSGYVMDPNAPVAPQGDGVASFSKDSGNKKTIPILNKSSGTVTLSFVQEPAAWVKIKLSKITIEAGKSIDMDVKAEGPFDKEKDSSLTVEAKGEQMTSRFTVAIHVGLPVEPYRKIRTAPKAPPSSPIQPEISPAKK